MISLAVAKVASVRSLVAPAGSWTIIIRLPWSSCGRKESGMFLYSSPATPPNAAYTTSIGTACFNTLATTLSYLCVPLLKVRLNQPKKPFFSS